MALLPPSMPSQVAHAPARTPGGVDPQRPRRLLAVAAAPLVLLLCVPVIGLFVGTDPESLWTHLGSTRTLEALGVSLATSTLATLLVAILGTPLALWLAARPRGSSWLEALVDLPIVMPPAVLGLALLHVLGPGGVLGEPLGLGLTFTPAAVIIAQIVVATPFYVQSAASGFRQVDPALVALGRTLGARPGAAFWRITWPLARASVLSGLLLAEARALGEFGATLLFAGNLPGRTQTMPLAIYTTYEADPAAAQAMALVLLAAALLLLMGVRRFGRRAGLGGAR